MQYFKPPEIFDRNGTSAGVLAERLNERRKWPIHYHSVEPFAMLADAATITASSVISGLLYHLHDQGSADDISKCLGAAILVSALFILLTKIRGMYKPAELLVLPRQVRVACLTWTTVFLLLAGAIFALKIGSEISRGTSIVFSRPSG